MARICLQATKCFGMLNKKKMPSRDVILESVKQIQRSCFVNGLPPPNIMRVLQTVYQVQRDTFCEQNVQKILYRILGSQEYNPEFIYKHILKQKSLLPVPMLSHAVVCILQTAVSKMTSLERFRITVNTVKTWLIQGHVYKALGMEYAAWLFLYNRNAPWIDVKKLEILLTDDDSRDIMWYIKQSCPDWQKCFDMRPVYDDTVTESDCDFCTQVKKGFL
jgi:hypothetical protein